MRCGVRAERGRCCFGAARSHARTRAFAPHACTHRFAKPQRARRSRATPTPRRPSRRGRARRDPVRAAAPARHASAGCPLTGHAHLAAAEVRKEAAPAAPAEVRWVHTSRALRRMAALTRCPRPQDDDEPAVSAAKWAVGHTVVAASRWAALLSMGQRRISPTGGVGRPVLLVLAGDRGGIVGAERGDRAARDVASLGAGRG